VSLLVALRDRASRISGLGESAGAAVLILAGFGVFLGAADQTSVVTILPKMIEGVGLPQDQFFRAAWIVNGYILGYVVAMPLMGRISDAFGHARVFAAALGVFVLGSALVAVSQDLTVLSIARAVQAVGAGALVPVAMAIVAGTMPVARRTFGLGAMAAAAEAGALFGPVWGGGIAQLAGWRGVFWINLPLCIPLALLMWRGAAGRAAPRRTGIDFAGAAILGAALVCLTVALTDDPISPRSVAATGLLYAASAVLFLAFLAWQGRARAPLVDLRMFRQAPLAAGFVANGMVGGVLIVAMVNIPLFTNVVLGGSAIDGGLNLMRLSVGVPIGAVAGGYFSTRFGLNRTAIAAMLLSGAGFLGMSRWTESPGFFVFSTPLLAAGLGLGLVIAPINSSVLDQVGDGERATVSSLLTVMRLIGGLVGVALLTTKGLGGFYAEAGLIPLDDPRYADLLRGLEVSAFRDTFLAAGLVCLATTIPARFLRLRQGSEAQAGGEQAAT
jgi:MFS family permease